jgi:hypothetical protein
MIKTFKIAAATTVVCALVFSATLFSCKKVTDNIRVKVNTNIFTSPTSVRLVNLNTTSVTKFPDKLVVKVTGAGAAKVYTSDGASTFTMYGGFMSLALDKSAAPSPANPINFTITGTLTGFAPIVYQVSITSDSAASIVIPVVEYANTPANTAVAVQSVSLTNNATTTVTHITAAGNIIAPVAATLTVDSGTIFEDVNKTPLNGGTLTAKIIQFGTDNSASIQSIPGGLSPVNVIGADGNPIRGGANMVPAGSLSIVMDVDGNIVRNFSTPIQAKIPLSPSLKNFVTGNAIAIGDLIPVWSMDETTGQWKNEDIATVTNVGGVLTASFNVTHLSTWNLAWAGTSCTQPLALHISPSDPKYNGGNYTLQLYTANGSPVGNVISTGLHAGSVVYINNVPSGQQLQVVVVDNSKNMVAVTTPVFTSCTTSDVTISVPVTLSSSINVATNFIGYCKNKNINANLTGTVNYQGTGALDYGSIAIVNGISAFTIVNGSTYTISCIYNNTLYATTIKFDKSNFAFPANSGITGNATYDANSNTLLLTGQILIANCN